MNRVRAFLLRDLRVERTYRAAMIGHAAGIVLFLGTFGLVAPVVRHDFAARYGASYFAYVAVGIAVTGALLSAMQAFGSAVREAQLEGTLEAIFTAPVEHRRLVAMMGVWPLVIGMAGSAVALAAAMIAGAGFSISVASLAIAAVLSAAAFVGLGLLSAAAVLVVKRGNPVAGLIGMVAAVTAGAYVPTSTFPSWLRWVAKANPMAYALQAWRGAMLSARSPLDLAGPLAVLALTAAIVVPAAWVALGHAVDHARRQGTLTTY
ncbi:MAG: putative transport protein [Acidimicrobiales bacterium]|jgi:ABC-2 type transport system permease protein|nr:putative transport protein [Acidimicrobiales bacterium]